VRRSATTLAIGLILAAAGCSGDLELPPSQGLSPPPVSPPGTTPSGPTVGPTTTPGSDCGAPSGDAAVVVTAADFAFTPTCVQAAPAQGVQLVNEGTATHTFTVAGTPVNVTAPAGTAIDGPPLGLPPGTYAFSCRFHGAQGMTGELRVVG
jgi:plastocyanin